MVIIALLIVVLLLMGIWEVRSTCLGIIALLVLVAAIAIAWPTIVTIALWIARGLLAVGFVWFIYKAVLPSIRG